MGAKWNRFLNHQTNFLFRRKRKVGLNRDISWQHILVEFPISLTVGGESPRCSFLHSKNIHVRWIQLLLVADWTPDIQRDRVKGSAEVKTHTVPALFIQHEWLVTTFQKTTSSAFWRIQRGKRLWDTDTVCDTVSFRAFLFENSSKKNMQRNRLCN